MKLVFIVNNKNNRLGKVLPGLCRFFETEYAGQVAFFYTLRKRHAVELARKATAEGCDYLIAVGGDGTLHEVVNGVFQSDLETGEYPVLGILPMGSANDFARTINSSRSVEELSERIRSHSIRRIDAGRINLLKTGETRCFINIAGVGLGPEVVQNMERSSGVLGPGLNYFLQIIKGFLHYTKKEVSCSSKSWRWEGRLLQMAIANGNYFGNAICVAPGADLSDGQFQVVIFGDLSIWDYLKNTGNLRKGKLIEHAQVYYRNTKGVLIESRAACSIEADGEYVGLLPASIELLPGALRFLMPTDTGSEISG